MNQKTCVKDKHGVSMVELLGYIVLFGSVFTLLSTTTFLIARASQSAYEKNRLNIGSTQLYSELLTTINRLQPDSVEIIEDPDEPKKIIFLKENTFNEEGNSVSVSVGELNKHVIYFDSTSNDVMIEGYEKGNDSAISTTRISLSVNVGIESFDFSIANESTGIKNIEVGGTLSNDRSTQDFIFSFPIYIIE